MNRKTRGQKSSASPPQSSSASQLTKKRHLEGISDAPDELAAARELALMAAIEVDREVTATDPSFNPYDKRPAAPAASSSSSPAIPSLGNAFALLMKKATVVSSSSTAVNPPSKRSKTAKASTTLSAQDREKVRSSRKSPGLRFRSDDEEQPAASLSSASSSNSSSSVPQPDGKTKQTRSSRGSATSQSKVPVHQRVKKFGKFGIVNNNGKVWCSKCKCPLSNIISSIRRHCDGAVHNAKDGELRKSGRRQAELSDMYAERSDSKVDPAVNAQRHHLVEVLVGLSIPCESLNSAEFRSLLSCNAPAATTAREYIPNILADLQESTAKSINQNAVGGFYSLVFDGTSNMGDMIVIIARWVDKQNGLQQAVLDLRIRPKHHNGQTLAIAIRDTILKLKLNPKKFIASIHDRADVNNAADNFLRSTWPDMFGKVISIPCFAHALNGAGEDLLPSEVQDFLNLWNPLIGYSEAARTVYDDMYQHAVSRSSETRWYTYFDQLQQWYTDVNGNPYQFLLKLKAEKISPKSVDALYRFLKAHPAIECYIAATIDMARPLRRGCAFIEGDSALSPWLVPLLDEIQKFGKDPRHPLLDQAAERYAASLEVAFEGQRATEKARIIKECRELMAKGYAWLEQKCQDKDRFGLANSLPYFEAAKLVNPFFIAEFDAVQVVEILKKTRLFSPKKIAKLKEELAKYKVEAQDALQRRTGKELERWWNSANRKEIIKNWYKVFCIFTLIHPTSASCERAFSMITNKLRKTQRNTHADMVAAMVTKSYNSSWRKRPRPADDFLEVFGGVKHDEDFGHQEEEEEEEDDDDDENDAEDDESHGDDDSDDGFFDFSGGEYEDDDYDD